MPNRREDFLRYALLFHGQPYRWGGYNPTEGFDCSGFVIELGKMTDLLPRGRDKDWTAGGLFELFQQRGSHVITDPTLVRPGDLLFWRNHEGGIRHIEVCYTKYEPDVIITIGASGGGSATISNAVAIQQDARIKIRRASPGWVALNPFGG